MNANPKLSRRLALGAALAALAPFKWADASVGSVEIIAPAGAGGGYDQLARASQQVLESAGLASAVQVVNVPGAGGTIGLAQLVTGRKRGNQLIVAGLGMVGAILINKSAVTLGQTTPLARLTGEYQPLVVPATSPIRSLADLKAAFDADPGAVSWGGFALGSPDHILSALTVKAFGGDVGRMNYIVSGAGGEMLAQIMGGHLTVACGGLNEFSQQIAAGELRALALSSPERMPGVDIPTFEEQGFDVTLINWRGLLAPATMRGRDLVALDEALGAMARTDEWKRIAAERGWVDLYMPSMEFQAFVREEEARVAGILREIGLA